MGWRSTLMGALVVGAVGFTAGRVFSQDAKPAEGPSAEDQAKWAEMSAPTEEHKKLAALAGTWDCDMTHIQDGKPVMNMKGVSTMKSAMKGLYLVTDHKSDMMGQPFEGLNVEGFSKEKKKYFSFWSDSFGTTPWLLWGTADGKTITYDGDLYDGGPMGKFYPRIKITHTDADNLGFEMWTKTEGAADYTKVMEGKYTRRK